jgi:hypothetical protein
MAVCPGSVNGLRLGILLIPFLPLLLGSLRSVLRLQILDAFIALPLQFGNLVLELLGRFDKGCFVRFHQLGSFRSLIRELVGLRREELER